MEEGVESWISTLLFADTGKALTRRQVKNGEGTKCSDVAWTLIVMIGITVLGFGLVIGSLFRVTIVDGEELQQKAIEQSLRNTSLSAQRGTIYDANGNILAQSASVWTVVLEPAYIEDDETRGIIADGLSEILDMDRESIMEKAKQQSYYTYLKRDVETEIKDEILAFMEEKEISVGLSWKSPISVIIRMVRWRRPCWALPVWTIKGLPVLRRSTTRS